MVSCAACGLSRTRNSSGKNVSFHRFPKNQKKLNKWIAFIDKIDWKPSTKSFLCSLHFSEDCFDRSSSLKIRLRDNALPSIIVQRAKYSRSTQKEGLLVPGNIAAAEGNLIVSFSTEAPSSTTTLSPVVEPSSPDKTAMEASAVSDTPRKVMLKRKIHDLADKVMQKSKKIRYLQKKTWAQKKQISSLRSVICEIKKKNLLNDECSETILGF